MSEYRGLQFWFVDTKGGVCFCDDCCKFQRPETFVPQYIQQGLSLRHGMQVTLVHCKQASNIALERLLTIHQPTNLQVLAAVKVQKSLPYGHEDKLPLPHTVIENMQEGEYVCAADTSGNFAFDVHFHYPMARKLPGILWCHVGMILMMNGTRHPLLR